MFQREVASTLGPDFLRRQPRGTGPRPVSTSTVHPPPPCIYPISPLYLPCIYPVFLLYLPCIYPISPLYLPCILPVSTLYLPCIFPIFPLYPCSPLGLLDSLLCLMNTCPRCALGSPSVPCTPVRYIPCTPVPYSPCTPVRYIFCSPVM